MAKNADTRRKVDTAAGALEGAEPSSRPRLVFVYSEKSGPSRRVDAFLAQILQSRRNHDTFDVIRVCFEKRPKLVAQLGVSEAPTLLVIAERTIQARVERPSGQAEIKAALSPWLK